MSLANLDGKTAIVTGAANGIGLALAEELIAGGMSVCLADIESEAMNRAVEQLAVGLKPGRRVISHMVDVSSPESVNAMVATAHAALGDIDLFCANAGVATARGAPVDETPLGDWHWQMNVNLFGVVHCMQACLPRMRAKRTASHILITASSSGILPTGNRAAYSASKYAVVGLGESLYLQLKGTPIGVSLLCPAVVATRMLDPNRDRPGAALGGGLSPAVLSKAKSPAAVARMAVESVKAGKFWILTHEDLGPAVMARAMAMASSSPPPDSYH